MEIMCCAYGSIVVWNNMARSEAGFYPAAEKSEAGDRHSAPGRFSVSQGMDLETADDASGCGQSGRNAGGSGRAAGNDLFSRRGQIDEEQG